MDGFGSILASLQRPEPFPPVISISGVLIRNNVLTGNSEIVGRRNAPVTPECFQGVLGAFDDMLDGMRQTGSQKQTHRHKPVRLF